MKSLARLISGLLVVVFALPAPGQVTNEDIDRARREVNRITAESADMGEQVMEAYGRKAALDTEIADLQESIQFAQIKITETESRLEELAVQLYMGTTSGASLSVLFSQTDQDYPAGLEYLREVRGVDRDVITQLRTYRDELDRQTARLDEALEEQVIVASELEQLAAQLQEDLTAAQVVYDDLVQQQVGEEAERRRQEEERRRQAEEAASQAAEAAATSTTTEAVTTTVSGATSTTAPAATTTTTVGTTTTAPTVSGPSGGTCPVAGAVTFTDTWGAPRSGGRTHKGVDMIAARGVPIVAAFSGTIYRLSTSTLGGNSVYFTSDAGDLYYYAHLDSYANISPGQHVPVGYVLGYNGSSGNAPEYLPHLHWEYHPGGGDAVNPYPLATELCL
ncbi:MAG TPA: peptidoglycan DD-metalloendopeptidase family protein [Acidimicrobiia bacterium]|jgi:murein DD-endopeptidase MepM/ murein hydrolase activator NlpD|nr:peptidoglycan DD-metalloendopeptidase family protein [Acidimicrobiia bacterium]